MKKLPSKILPAALLFAGAFAFAVSQAPAQNTNPPVPLGDSTTTVTLTTDADNYWLPANTTINASSHAINAGARTGPWYIEPVPNGHVLYNQLQHSMLQKIKSGT